MSGSGAPLRLLALLFRSYRRSFRLLLFRAAKRKAWSITTVGHLNGQTKVVPQRFRTTLGPAVGVYLQVYNAGIDQTTLRPSVDVEYALSRDGKELGKQVEDWRGMSDSGQRLTLARLIDSSGLTAGEYELTIRIRDRVSGQTLSPSAKFTVIQ